MNYLTAQVTDVAIGNFTIVGLKDEQGNYYVGVPQLALLVLEEDSRNQASQTFKRLMGKDFKTNRLKTEFNKNITLGIPLVEFEKLLARLDRTGNLKAQQLRDDLVGLSLHQLVADAFNDKVEKEERQEYLKARQSSIDARALFSDAVKDYVARHPERSDGFKKYAYSNATDRLYRGIFGKSTKQLKKQKQLPEKVNLRNYFDAWELTQLEHREVFASHLVNKEDMEPDDAVDKALQFYL